MPNLYPFNSPAIVKEFNLRSLQITITLMAEGALLIYLQTEAEKFLARLGSEPDIN